jgi:hypothetical protein
MLAAVNPRTREATDERDGEAPRDRDHRRDAPALSDQVTRLRR